MSDNISKHNLVLIAKYLPVKSLLRFRTLSKGWKQRIDSSDFMQEHLSVQKPRFFMEYEGRKYLVVDPRPRPLIDTLKKLVANDYFSIIGTLHGVVCLLDIDSFMLWNPSVRKSLSVPLPLGVEWSMGHAKNTCYGFWIDPCSKEFKIVVVRRKHGVNCYVYSSRRSDWSAIPSGEFRNWKLCKEGPPVMIGRVAHWGGCLEEFMGECGLEHFHQSKVILSFDFVQESFDVIKIPDRLICSRISPFRWQGVLSLVCWNDEFPRECEIYLRQENSWVKRCSFEVYESLMHVFWAMEDFEEIKKKGKRKRGMEEQAGPLTGGKEENFRVLGTIIVDSATTTGELVLDGTKTGCKALRKGLEHYDKVSMAYDFVESLLFP